VESGKWTVFRRGFNFKRIKDKRKRIKVIGSGNSEGIFLIIQNLDTGHTD